MTRKSLIFLSNIKKNRTLFGVTKPNYKCDKIDFTREHGVIVPELKVSIK